MAAIATVAFVTLAGCSGVSIDPTTPADDPVVAATSGHTTRHASASLEDDLRFVFGDDFDFAALPAETIASEACKEVDEAHGDAKAAQVTMADGMARSDNDDRLTLDQKRNLAMATAYGVLGASISDYCPEYKDALDAITNEG